MRRLLLVIICAFSLCFNSSCSRTNGLTPDFPIEIEPEKQKVVSNPTTCDFGFKTQHKLIKALNISCTFKDGYVTRWNDEGFNTSEWKANSNNEQLKFSFKNQEGPKEVQGNKIHTVIDAIGNHIYVLTSGLSSGTFTMNQIIADNIPIINLITVFPRTDAQGQYIAVLNRAHDYGYKNSINAGQFYGACWAEALQNPVKETQGTPD